ncbi:hypothetical protein JIN85_03545 [Luteolibacter pohnpeiensis]|uniref:DUF4124 domain-containing protein n=1 Tax=Luteolibacter pohnpeiensis TaxID=454153 RepID=A0A934S5D5_9BACT|nr:hypothetical protein [Luteolibacter pohnpeiensis]MBK1881474.1 hypothetical protein [Luteolibacter pohnpeiensis]
MKRHFFLFTILLTLGTSATSNARSWTNAEGKVIEADYVSHSGDKVVLKINGREIS